MKIYLQLLVFCGVCLASPLWAMPEHYDLEPSASKIEFSYRFGQETITGSFPDFTIDLTLDFTRVSNSKVSVVVQTQTARGGFAFATQALRSAEVLDVEHFPEMFFRSTSVRRQDDVIVVDGMVTIRGVTKPMQLFVRMFAAKDATTGGIETATLKMIGKVNRNDFGASGYADLVGPVLRFDIVAKVVRRP